MKNGGGKQKCCIYNFVQCMSPLDATNASFIVGFIVFVWSHHETPS